MKTPTPPPDLDTDPDAPASDKELCAAGELRDALADPTRANDDASLARALVLAHSPRALDERENAALVERALAKPASAVTRVSAARARRSRGARAAWGGASAAVAALAAAALVFLGSRKEPVGPVMPEAPALRYARSTQPLFHEPFAARGGASERVDRIASARAEDLRENRFAQWEVP